jgi:hypothetical protein
VANTYLKATKIARTAIGLLYRELVVARTIWTDAVAAAEFKGAFEDTVTLRVPARRTARTRTLRAGTQIINDESTELSVAVKLDTDVYNSAPITDEELTLDIVSFGTQILAPQTRAVAEGIEDVIVSKISGATYPSTIELNNSNPYATAVAARKILNDNNVPKTGRTMLVGSAVEAAMLLSDKFIKVSELGPQATAAFSESVLGRVAGFTVVQSNAVAEDAAYAYHRSAFVAAVMPPANPDGATMSKAISYGGIGMRWLKDYNYLTTTDRSLVDSWVGTAVVEDNLEPDESGSEQTLLRAVKIVDLES